MSSNPDHVGSEHASRQAKLEELRIKMNEAWYKWDAASRTTNKAQLRFACIEYHIACIEYHNAQAEYDSFQRGKPVLDAQQTDTSSRENQDAK